MVNPGVEPSGVGVAMSLRDGVVMGWYPGGGSRILYPVGGNMASSSSSVMYRFRSSISRSHRSLCAISGVMGTDGSTIPGVIPPRPIPAAPAAPRGVAPGVAAGVAAPATGVSSHRDRLRPAGVAPGVSASPPPASDFDPRPGVASHRDLPPTRPGVASKRPGVASKRPGVASKRPGVASKRPGVASNRPGVASNRPGVAPIWRPGVASKRFGVASKRPGVASNRPGVASNRPGVASNRPGVASPSQDLPSPTAGVAATDTPGAAAEAAPPSSQRRRFLVPVAVPDPAAEVPAFSAASCFFCSIARRTSASSFSRFWESMISL
mmetsp:Transcript_11784/g.34026  ORF Transcript_11784/g.34026 Transcript_11784/m.34026 type:complete len:323 (-) Transcript_11784:451-1419(-)